LKKGRTYIILFLLPYIHTGRKHPSDILICPKHRQERGNTSGVYLYATEQAGKRKYLRGIPLCHRTGRKEEIKHDSVMQ
jgi:hypothetical protein